MAEGGPIQAAAPIDGAPPGPNAQALQQLVNRNELQDEAQRVGLCDGEDSHAVTRFMEEIIYVPDNLKLAVIRRTVTRME